METPEQADAIRAAREARRAANAGPKFTRGHKRKHASEADAAPAGGEPPKKKPVVKSDTKPVVKSDTKPVAKSGDGLGSKKKPVVVDDDDDSSFDEDAYAAKRQKERDVAAAKRREDRKDEEAKRREDRKDAESKRRDDERAARGPSRLGRLAFL